MNAFKLVAAANQNPVVNYLALYSMTDHAWISTGGNEALGSTLRIYYGISDAETPSSGLTVSISYRTSGGGWVTKTALYDVPYNYWYFDWVIPGGATPGFYDVKVDVSDPNGGSTSSTTMNAFKLV
jgi:hypothetical protein